MIKHPGESPEVLANNWISFCAYAEIASSNTILEVIEYIDQQKGIEPVDDKFIDSTIEYLKCCLKVQLEFETKNKK